MSEFKPIHSLENLEFFGEHSGVNPSISDSSTYSFRSAETMLNTFEGKTEGCYLYARHSTPSTMYLGKALAAIEGAEAAQVTASGMGAISATLLQLCKSGDHIVSSRTVYGGTYALMKNFLPQLTISTSFVNITDLAAVEAAFTTHTKVLYCETVSNPLLEIADLPKLAALAHKYGAQLVVDNTFSPLSMAPIQWGADVVIHSLTKYINGTSDAIGGVICGKQRFIEALCDVKNGATMLLGPTLDSLRAAGILKNLHSLHVRLKQHSANALYLARHFEEVGVKTIYPGLQTHPSHQLYQQLGNLNFGYGGMLGIDAESLPKAYALMEEMQRQKVGLLAVSLGFYKTLFSASGNSTSSEIPEEERQAMGLSEGLIRLSVGLDYDITLTWRTIKSCLLKAGLLQKE